MENNPGYFCPSCGEAIEDKAAKFCPKCGSKLNMTDENGNMIYEPSAKSRLGALILCLLFGSLGIHRFYTGRIFGGIAMCILSIISIIAYANSTVGMLIAIPVGLWVIIDFLLILCGVFKDRQGKYLITW